mgnify:CR=1 FL=1
MPDLLSPYRVLDLTNERGLLCGQVLADLVADGGEDAPRGGEDQHVRLDGRTRPQ